MKKILIASLAATSLIAGFGAANAVESFETQLFRDRGANIVTPEDRYAPVPYRTSQANVTLQGQATHLSAQMSGGYGDSLER